MPDRNKELESQRFDKSAIYLRRKGLEKKTEQLDQLVDDLEKYYGKELQKKNEKRKKTFLCKTYVKKQSKKEEIDQSRTTTTLTTTTTTTKRKLIDINNINKSNNHVEKRVKMYDYTNTKPSQASTPLTPAAAINSDDGGGVGGGIISGALIHSDNNKHYLNAMDSGMATLYNIGNTCYLNSVVYTLRFAPSFLHNLHHLVDDLAQIGQRVVDQHKAKSSSLGRNVGGLHGSNTRSWSTKDLASVGQNVTSTLLTSSTTSSSSATTATGSNSAAIMPLGDVPKTPHQIATEKLHELFHNLHRNEMVDSIEGFHADTFLNAVQDVSSIFGGNQQQDAHEFLMCVLDSIRETCLSLTKFISDCPDFLVNGYVSVPEKNETAPVQHQSIPIVKGLPFFRKRNKEDKPKNNRLNSPMKESDLVADSNGTGKSLAAAMTIASTAATTTTTTTLTTTASTTILSGIDATTTTTTTTSLSSTTATTTNAKTMTSSDDIHDKTKLNEKIQKFGFNFFSEDFEGVTVSSTKCLSCETVTEKEETMIDISVPITGYESNERGDKNDSQQFIKDMCVTSEFFRSENKYRCEVCSGLTEAIRTVKYKKLPRLLIIQLKRFSGGMEKINSYIPTPFILNCFCAKCCTLSDKDKLHVYKLYSVITHVGATLSVGHYIAYTSSLDGHTGDYLNCPKDRRRLQQKQQQAMATQSMAGDRIVGEKNPSIMKKMMFGRSKASSSGDVTKNINGGGGGSVFGKSIINGLGIDRLNLNGNSSSSSNSSSGSGGNNNNINNNNSSNNGPNLNTPCQSLHCCGIHMKNGLTAPNNGSQNLCNGLMDYPSAGRNTHIYTGDSQSTKTTLNGHGLNHQPTGASITAEPIWYMCDDDKIKAMSQAEFKDLLSPNSKKIMVTPYLLFYARIDLRPTSTTVNATSSSTTTTKSSNLA